LCLSPEFSLVLVVIAYARYCCYF